MQDQQTSNFPPNTEAFAYRFNMQYKHRAYPNEGMCRIEMYKSNGDVLIVATELKDNPGPSVDNCIEAIYEKLSQVYDLTPDNTILVTRFCKDSYYHYWGPKEQDRYSIVSITPDGSFKHIGKHRVLEAAMQHMENGGIRDITEILDEVL